MHPLVAALHRQPEFRGVGLVPHRLRIDGAGDRLDWGGTLEGARQLDPNRIQGRPHELLRSFNLS